MDRTAMQDNTQVCPHCSKPFDIVAQRGKVKSVKSSPLALHIRHKHTDLPGSASYNLRLKVS
jgi:hypothetical protein